MLGIFAPVDARWHTLFIRYGPAFLAANLELVGPDLQLLATPPAVNWLRNWIFERLTPRARAHERHIGPPFAATAAQIASLPYDIVRAGDRSRWTSGFALAAVSTVCVDNSYLARKNL